MDKNAPIDERTAYDQRGENFSRPLDSSPYGMMIFQHDQLVFSNLKAADMFGCTPDELNSISLNNLSAQHMHADDCKLFLQLVNSVQSGEILPIQPNIRLRLTDGSLKYVNVLVNLTLLQGEPALQVHWMVTNPRSGYPEPLQDQVDEFANEVLTASAMATDVNQTLEVILVNLRNVLAYDRVGLFLLDKDEHFILAGNTNPEELSAIPSHGFSDPVVLELQRTKKPLVVEDIQVDERFAAWPDMPPLHSWIGAPLIVGNKVTGFLSLGSLEIGEYDQDDAAIVQTFVTQISSVLEKAWLHEQSHRRTDELEVLSRFTIALGQAEGRGDILEAIMDQITNFFGAVRGVVLFPDEIGISLQVKFSLDETLIGLSHPQTKDLLWHTYQSGRSRVIENLTDLINSRQGEIFADLFAGLHSAVLIPLKSGDTTTGILCFGFEEQREFPVEDINLYNTIAEIAGPSLHRAIMLEALEKQVELRTQHLSTLYAINNFAGERRDLSYILDQVLNITLEAMNNQAGAIYLLNETEAKLRLVTHQNLPPDQLDQLQTFNLDEPKWRELTDAPLPQILHGHKLGVELLFPIQDDQTLEFNKILAAPIRAKGQPLGLLINFSDNTLEYNEEDIVLFGTIADQIGMFVERAHLITQAEQAAVVEERQRLARELHDSVTQLLYSQVLFSGASLKVLNQDNLPLTEQYLTRIEQAAQQALKEMRLLVFELRPTDQLDENLFYALRKRLDAVEKRSGMQTHLVFEGDLTLDKNVEISIYRIIQEALNNTLKHAGAKSVTVTLRQERDSFEVEIADDGCGFNYQECLEGGGMGLGIMLERTAMLGGKMQVETKPGAGTRVRATFGALL
jgi:signal transduction histidine kinase/putative methionine-R-sulfoxide reductase with GAF domain